MNGVILDVIVIAVILIAGLIGIWQGFFKSILSLVGTIGALIIAILLREQIATLLNNMFGWETGITNGISNALGGINPALTDFKSADINELLTYLNSSNMNGILKSLLGSMINGVTLTEAVSIAQIVAKPIAHFIMVIIGIAIAYILLRIVVVILNLTVGRLAKGRIFGKANKVLGFIVGLAKGGILIVCLMAVVSMLCMIPAINDYMSPLIENSIITKFGYNLVNDFVLNNLSGINFGDIPVTP